MRHLNIVMFLHLNSASCTAGALSSDLKGVVSKNFPITPISPCFARRRPHSHFNFVPTFQRPEHDGTTLSRTVKTAIIPVHCQTRPILLSQIEAGTRR